MASLREQVKRLQKRPARDYDPEDDAALSLDESSSEGEDIPGLHGREHYEKVGKSRLRKLEQPRLGPKYGGIAVNRTDLEDADEEDSFAPVREDENDDPFAERAGNYVGPDISHASHEDENSESDVGEGDDKWKILSYSNGLSASTERANELELADGVDPEEDETESDKGLDSDLDMDDIDEEDGDMSDATSLSHSSTFSDSNANSAKRELLDLMRKDTARVAATLSTNEDAKQGHAVSRQQSAYDRLLDARIKLQKGVTASNSMSSESITDAEAKEAFQKVEAAALELWSTIDSIRCNVLSNSTSASTGSTTKKRKLPTALGPTSTTPLTDLWTHSTALESHSLPRRRAVLDYWSNRTKASAPSRQSHSKLASIDGTEPVLSSILDEYLSREMSNLVASSTASSSKQRQHQEPHQHNSQDTLSPQPIHFSDDSFYQSLLRDLIASRTDNPFPNSIMPSSTSSARPAPINSQKNRRGVDTKASKGRKIRYTVHEKLVSFMAPEDRSTWAEAARREFFGSLFGGRPLENSDGENEDIDYEGNGESPDLFGGRTMREEGALRLFRS